MAIQQLTKEFKELKINPPEGFNVELVDDDVFVWEVGIFGTPETIYEGAYLKAILHFPSNYPFSPFKMTFITEMWHPNVFEDGKVCISILHPPGEDPLNTFERPEERWSPAQTVSNVVMSVVSMLNEPETRSPANIAASVMYQRNKEEYNKKVRELVQRSREAALSENIEIPTTVEAYTARSVRARQKSQLLHARMHEEDDFFSFSETGDSTSSECGYSEEGSIY